MRNAERHPPRRGAATGPSPTLGLLLVLLLTVSVRLILLAGNLAAHPDLLVQDLRSVEASLADSTRPYMNTFGFEASNIAHALVCSGEGFSSPFGGATGPTAWISPGVVALYAVAFALFGCFTPEAVLFVFAIALVVSVMTAAAVFQIGARIGGTGFTGLAAAAFFALLPFEAWIFRVSGQLDFNLQVAWFAILLLTVLRALEADRRSRIIELGLVSSAAALFNPGFILCTATALPFLAHGRTAREIARLGAILVVVHAAVVGPYVAWQSFRLGGLVPVKSNGAFEFALGNSPPSDGILSPAVFSSSHPSQNPVEFSKYRELGEMAYIRSTFESFVREASWPDFFGNTLRRCRHFFSGYEVKQWDVSVGTVAVKAAFWLLPLLSLAALIVIRRGRLPRLEYLLLMFTLAYSLPYLVTGIMERYRLPMVTPIAVMLALVTAEVGPILSGKSRARKARSTR